jgi:hypothetical protein
MSVVDAFSERAARRANGTVKEPPIAAYPQTDRFPSSAQHQSLRTSFLARPSSRRCPRTLTPLRDGAKFCPPPSESMNLSQSCAFSAPPWHFIRHDIAIGVLMGYARNHRRPQPLSAQ